ncbi:MAG: hypothetical protein GKR89_35870 [Candidatus Latescibacteria bacterium]|nr:hypothetical protein [Candidatus Latescibacterota bacterium]
MAIKFKIEEPITLVFPFGDFMDVNGQYGPQFLYTVEVDRVRDRLYATPRLHQQLQEAEVGPGSEMTITKVEGEGAHNSWLVETPAPAPEAGPISAPNGQSNGTASANTNPRRRPANSPDFETMDQLIDCCLRASWDAWHGLDQEKAFSSEDVRAVGITLFLECARKGIAPLSIEEGLPY